MAISQALSDLHDDYRAKVRALQQIDAALRDGLAAHLVVTFAPADSGSTVDAKIAGFLTAHATRALAVLTEELQERLKVTVEEARAAIDEQYQLELGTD
jgi:hypothetical protein